MCYFNFSTMCKMLKKLFYKFKKSSKFSFFCSKTIKKADKLNVYQWGSIFWSNYFSIFLTTSCQRQVIAEADTYNARG